MPISLDVLNSGGGVVPNSVVYKYSDPFSASIQFGQNLPSMDCFSLPEWSKDCVAPF